MITSSISVEKPNYLIKTVAEVEKDAANLGLVCTWPTDNELFLDLDFTCILPSKVYQDLLRNNFIEDSDQVQLVTVSKSGKWHMYLRLKEPLPLKDRLILQACLSSDPTKELLSIRSNYCALFERPEEATNVMKWRSQFAD